MSADTSDAAGGVSSEASPSLLRKFFSLPKTIQGQRSLALMTGFFAFMMIFFMVVLNEDRNVVLFSILIGIAALFGLAGGVLGLMAIIKHKERSSLTFFAVLIGSVVLLFALGEVLAPH